MRPTLGTTASLGIKAGSMVNASVKSAPQTKHTWLLYLNASFSEDTFVTLSQWNDRDSSLPYSPSLVFRLRWNGPSFITIRVNPEGPPPPDPRQSCALCNFFSAGHSVHLHLKQSCHLYCPLWHKTLTAYQRSISFSFLVWHQLPKSLIAQRQVYFISGSSATQYLTDSAHQLSSAVINGKAEEPLELQKKREKSHHAGQWLQLLQLF